jgi:transposase
MSAFDHKVDPRAVSIRRVEVITGVERRRRWPEVVKERIVLEALEPGAVVSMVARRHDLRPQQLFGWLREARRSGALAARFVPVTVEADPRGDAAGDNAERDARDGRGQGAVEVWFDSARVRAERGADVALVAAVIAALRDGP